MNIKELHKVDGPLCLNCASKLEFDEENLFLGKCPVCDKEHKFEKLVSEMRKLAIVAYQAKVDNELETISLDSPLQPIKDRDEDEKYWVEVKLGHTNDGRKIAIAYIGDKVRGTKTQAFIDLDNEQLRTDRSDAKPHEIVASLKVEFLHSTHEVKKKS